MRRAAAKKAEFYRIYATFFKICGWCADDAWADEDKLSLRDLRRKKEGEDIETITRDNGVLHKSAAKVLETTHAACIAKLEWEFVHQEIEV